MDSKKTALTALFSALAIALSPGVSKISIPSPFFGLPYQVWEIPVFVAFLSIGLRPGILVACVGCLAILVFQPTLIGIGSIIACIAMLAGFYLAYKLATRNMQAGAKISSKKTVAATTAGGMVFRIGAMAIQNYFMLPLILNVPQSFLLGVVIPLVAVFNATEPLYVIPLSYFAAKAIRSNLKISTSPQL